MVVGVCMAEPEGVSDVVLDAVNEGVCVRVRV